MKFLLNSTQDLDGIENASNYHIITCKFINWPWHSDCHGCFLLLDKNTNELYHVYRHQTIHFDEECVGVPEIVRVYDMEFDYNIKHYFAPEKLVEIQPPPQPSPPSLPIQLPILLPPPIIQVVNNVRAEQFVRFSVKIGLDMHSVNGAFNVDIFGLRVYNHLYSLLELYVSLLLPQLNNVLTSNQLKAETLNHLVPEQLFDVIVRYNSQFVFLRPCTIVREWCIFLDGLRTQIFGIIQALAESNHSDVNEIFATKEKFREKKICSASTFASSRHIVNEFRCPSKNVQECPHIVAVTNAKGQLELRPDVTLCHFLLASYLDHYEESFVNITFGFHCKFASNRLLPTKRQECLAVYNRSTDHAQNNITIFQALFGRHVLLHRMCIPAKYLTVDWFRFVLKLFNLEQLLQME